MKELALIVIAIILTFGINYWKMDERVIRLEALVKCLESEMIALRRKIALDEDGDSDDQPPKPQWQDAMMKNFLRR